MKQLLESILKDWWNKPTPSLVPRSLDLMEFTNLPFRKAICITGFRRVGKTYLLFDLANKLGVQNCAYINFEDERLPRETQLLSALLEILTQMKGSQPLTLLLDEIQDVPRWSLWARRVLDSTPHQLFITGSSSKISSSQLPTEMRGRSLSVHVSPLNFDEFTRFNNHDPLTQSTPQNLFMANQYLMYGGFPEVVLADTGKKTLLLDEYFQTFMLRDLVERHRIRHGHQLRMFIRLLVNSPYFTVSKLTNVIKSQGADISKPTLIRYLDFLKQSYFFTPALLHTPSLKNRFKAAQKPYFVDTGIVSRLSTQFSQNTGLLMEQAVFAKLSNNNREIYYWQDYAKHEVDFVVRDRETVIRLVQVCYVSDGEHLPEREAKSLMKAARILKCRNLHIITWDLEKSLEIGQETISLIPFWKFLLT